MRFLIPVLVTLFASTALGGGSSAPPVRADPEGIWEVRWDRTFVGWKPPIFEGRLRLQRRGGQWSGDLAFRQSSAGLTLLSLAAQGDQLLLAFAANGSTADKLELSGWLHEDRLIGEIRWANVGWSPVGGRRIKVLPLKRAQASHGLPAGPGAREDVYGGALAAILDEAAAQRSSAVVIARDGRVLVEAYGDAGPDAPLVAMSASKAVVSLAIGLLIVERKLALDTPVASLLPEWRSGPRESITIRHLLTHTSGLDPKRAAFESESIHQRAVESQLVFKPGTRFQYNNNAVDLLAWVAGRAAGVPLDEYLESHLFRKLDFVGARWMKDREGTPRGAGELFIRPIDLAKIGQLMLDGGTWQGERILPREWIDASIAPGQPFAEDCGFLWWREGSFADVLDDSLLAAWREAGVMRSLLDALRPIAGKRFVTRDAYLAAIRTALGPAGFDALESKIEKGDHIPFSRRVADGPARGYSARGWLGQLLVVYPVERLVAVRMRTPGRADYEKDAAEVDGYRAFAEDVLRIANQQH